MKLKIEKKNKNVLFLLLVIVVLLACYLGLLIYNRSREKAEARAVEENTVYLTDLEEIKAVRYDTGTEEMAFIKSDDTWYVEDDTEFPLNQTYPLQIAESFGKLQAVRKLEGGDALADYGLDAPAYTVELTGEDGVKTKIQIGNAVGDNYYATVDDIKEVYTISGTVVSDLQYSLDEMAQLDMMPSVGSGNLIKETITEDGKTTVYDAENEEDSEAIAAAAGGLGAVTLDTVVNYSAQDRELVQYGLDEAERLSVEVIYNSDGEEQTLLLYLGDESGEDTTYVMINDSRIVYEVSTEVCNNILNRE